MANAVEADARLPIAIIGGGVAGLAAAYRLTQAGRKIRLFEASPRLGGVIRSVRDGAWLSEAGPNSFQESSTEIVALLKELGLDSERLHANPSAKKRFIVREGKLRPLPSSPGSFLTTPLFSAKAKLRILTEPLMRARQRRSDVDLATFIVDHFGQEVVDYAVNPFVSGIYAGDATKLSTRHAFPTLWESEQKKGSLIRGMMAAGKEKRAKGNPRSSIISFRGGLQVLTDALAANIPPNSVLLNSTVERLEPGEPWKVFWSRDGELGAEEFGGVILALPANSLAQLRFGMDDNCPLQQLAKIEYAPVTSLFLGFRRDQVGHPLDGFGALIPSGERRQILGAIFSSSLFPNRAPPDHVALTVLSGGTLNPATASGTDQDIVQRAHAELRTLIGLRGEAVVQKITRWPRAIPQYQLGYERYLDAICATERAHPGLIIAGQVRDGISLQNCVLSGLRAGATAMNFPSEKPSSSE